MAALAQQKAGELLAGPARGLQCGKPGTDQIAHRLVPGIRHLHRRQLTGPIQPRQTGGVPPICLDAIARPFGDQ